MKFEKFFLALLFLQSISYSAEEFVVITHPDNSIDSISPKSLKDIITGTQNRWQSGKAVRLVFYEGGEFHTKFVESVTGSRVSRFTRAWKRSIFTGRAMAPREVETYEEMVAYILKHPGSFGYVPSGEVGEAKVLEVK